MLVLSRRHGEQILVGDNVVIKVLGVTHGRVRMGIEAPREVQVRRSELLSKDRFVSPAAKTSPAGRRARSQADIAQVAGIAH